jgi:endonuclease III
MAQTRSAMVLKILKQNIVYPRWFNSNKDPFRILIKTIISQNTADRNTDRAFETLSKQFKITPEALAKAEIRQIEEAIKVAGLYKSKSRSIKQVSNILLEKHSGDMQKILKLPLNEARETLKQLPGVGPKTADVVLLFSENKPTIPVDTHVNRVAKRLGFAPTKANYEAVRSNLQAIFNPSDFLALHLLLIEHGRKTCKAIKPRCKECSISSYCPSEGLWD